LGSIRSSTVNELLFREISEDSFKNGFGRFTRSTGRESPARSTLSLVFNSLNVSFGDPIDVSDEVGVSVDFSGFDLFGDFGSEVNAFEFCFGQIRELVDDLGVGLGFVGIVLFDLLGVLHENSESISLFSWASVRFCVLNFEAFELKGGFFN